MEISDQQIKKKKLCVLCLSEGGQSHRFQESTPEYLKFILENMGYKKNDAFFLCPNCEKAKYTG